MNKTIDTETLLLKVESHEHRIGIMENLLRDAKQVLTLEEQPYSWAYQRAVSTR